MERVDIDRYLRFDILFCDEFSQLVDCFSIRGGGLVGVEYLSCIPDDKILFSSSVEPVHGNEVRIRVLLEVLCMLGLMRLSDRNLLDHHRKAQ